MDIKQKVNWHFPPAQRKGNNKNNHDIKEIFVIKSDLFIEPVIAMSDIHSHAPRLIIMLDNYLYLNKFVILTTGDMAGNFMMECDGDPTQSYIFLNRVAKEFYFVQGNHDLPNDHHQEKKIKKKNYSMIPDGKSVTTLIGKISGVNGIISNRSHPYKMPKTQYINLLRKSISTKPSILMTHDTPEIPNNIGDNDIFKIVDKSNIKVHFFGHCHHDQFHHLINGTNYFNLDDRVLIFIPNELNVDDHFKTALEDQYLY